VTDSDVSSLIESVASVKSLVFSTHNGSIEKSISDLDIPFTHKEYLLSRMKEENISTGDRNQLVEQLDLVVSEIRDLPVYNAKLAFDPSRSLIEEVGIWCKKRWGRDAILAIEVDPSIIGGIILTANGSYFDYSVKSKLNKQFKVILDNAQFNL
jgi:hypothetical protein